MSPQSTRRVWRTRALTAIASVCAAALLVEATSWLLLAAALAPAETDAPLTDLVVTDPRLGWKGAPGLRAQVVGPSFELPLFRYSVSSNGEGFRGKAEIPSSAAGAGVQRVVVLGDSFPWGWGVDDDEVFPAVLQELLGDGFQVLNLGVIGYSTDQAFLLLTDRIEALRPQVVVLPLLLNDIEGNLVDHNYGMPKPRLSLQPSGGWRWIFPSQGETEGQGWVREVAEQSRAVELLSRMFGETPDKAELLSPAQLEQIRRQSWQIYREDEIQHFVASLSELGSPTRELTVRLAALCAHFGARLVLMPVPHHHAQHLYSPYHVENSGGQTLTEAVQLMARGVGVEVCLVAERMREAVAAGENLDVGDGHLTPAGHRILGTALGNHLVR